MDNLWITFCLKKYNENIIIFMSYKMLNNIITQHFKFQLHRCSNYKMNSWLMWRGIIIASSCLDKLWVGCCVNNLWISTMKIIN